MVGNLRLMAYIFGKYWIISQQMPMLLKKCGHLCMVLGESSNKAGGMVSIRFFLRICHEISLTKCFFE